MSEILVGKWDCTQCGHKRIDGESYVCPACGSRRSEDVEFYLDESDTRVANNKNENPDWSCQYCDYLNSDDSSVCQSCGHTRESADRNYFQEKEIKDRIREEYQEEIELEPTIKTIFGNNIIFFLSLTLIAIIGFFGYKALFEKTQATVINKTWETVLQTETYKEVTEEDWELPNKATLISKKKEIHHYNKVQDGYRTETYKERVFSHNKTVTKRRNLGNGKFKTTTTTQPVYKTVTKTRSVPKYKQVPIYKDKYTYKIWKWVTNPDMINKGTYKEEIKFPDFVEVQGKERIANKNIKYHVQYSKKKNKKQDEIEILEITREEWNSLEMHQEIELKGGEIVWEEVKSK